MRRAGRKDRTRRDDVMEPRDPAWAEVVARIFAAQGMMATLGAELVSVAPGRVVVAAPVRPQTGQQHGYAHAALAWALGDTAAGCAAQTLFAAGDGVLTVEMKINLLAPAKGQALRATGSVERPGRTLTVVRAEVVALDNGRETPVALLQGTMMRISGGAGGSAG
jgi:uncharacterized protein (TIGR00369 family)